MTGERPHIVFIGPIPPPMHGMAAVSAEMVRALEEQAAVTALPVQPDPDAQGAARHLSKAKRAIAALAGLARARERGARLLYIAVDDGLGGLWTTLFVLAARLIGLEIYLHHHSYRYILARSAVMRAIVRAAGPAARHVTLCEAMAGDFARAYPRAKHRVVAPNSVDAGPERRAPAVRPLTIGLLSNLTPEKGTAEFIRILDEVRAGGTDIRGRLAGPAVDGRTKALIEARCGAGDGALEWAGPVHGQAKEDFFAGIDLFVFPTRYRTESFGLVLMEALVRGIPVAAPRRGCICELAGLDAAEIVPLDEDFEARAIAWINGIARQPGLLARLSAGAAAQGNALNREHRAEQMALIDEMVAAAGA